jgi:RNA polymerase sigma-70 factor (ECF subfamily)
VHAPNPDWATEYVKIRSLSFFPRTADRAGSDAALLARIIARDSSALGELYDAHSQLLFGLIFRILKNPDEAEEVLQEVFAQAWTRSGTYHPAFGSPAGWLVGIARNRAIDRLRENAAKGRPPEPAPMSPVADTAERRASLGEQQLDIRRALDALPSDQRDLIEQAYFLGLTQSELAARFGLPLETVKTRIRSGMQALRDHLEAAVTDQ